MHNIKFIRREPDLFLKKLGHRNVNVDLKSLLDVDKEKLAKQIGIGALRYNILKFMITTFGNISLWLILSSFLTQSFFPVR